MTHARRRTLLAAGAVTLAGFGATGFAAAQVNCDTMVGPARPDCYIGLARINRQRAGIAAGVARQQTDAANLYKLTRKRPKMMPAPKANGD
jgi:hypothetical protein